MNGRSVIIFCAAFASLSSRGDTNIPPSAIYGGGSFDGHAFTQLITYSAPASATARFAGGFFDGHDFTQLATYSAPANANVRFPGGSFDGHAITERDTFAVPTNAYARFAGGSLDGHAITERDTFDFATLAARFSGGFFDGNDLTSFGPFPNPLNRDTDGDGIPDWWEALYFRNVFGAVPNLDQDGDGMTTWQEYIADTDPTDPNSTFAVHGIFVTNTVGVMFSVSSSNRLYTFEYSTNLPSGVWLPVPGVPQRHGIGGPDTFADPATATNRANYRVRVNGP